ncbi:hypothetical protein Tb09.v1.0970 [Trypanosoma brucei brucei TREU927]|uniref:Uncharacterized protein n=1 Tax=Trypanosoma brucei brucei (strain 927/4 GUTat10.1) TaxID=185431 RepID=Q38CM9_TRYB2|nr:hypothetical protein Tb09.v1.0970 [Trypanosoma brucei brucei TREU927]EAN77441.1 hypothetical protein Tb09.v1.0970 [Trypanosoma brucei brucei TREU927]
MTCRSSHTFHMKNSYEGSLRAIEPYAVCVSAPLSDRSLSSHLLEYRARFLFLSFLSWSSSFVCDESELVITLFMVQGINPYLVVVYSCVIDPWGLLTSLSESASSTLTHLWRVSHVLLQKPLFHLSKTQSCGSLSYLFLFSPPVFFFACNLVISFVTFLIFIGFGSE